MVLTAGLGVVMGLVAVSVLMMTTVIQRGATLGHTLVERQAAQIGAIHLGAAVLTERLQTPAPLTGLSLHDVGSSFVIPHSSFVIEDEGGKLSLPLNIFAMPSVMKVYGVRDAVGRSSKLAAAWNIPVLPAPNLAYPMLNPSSTVKGFPRFESAEDLGAFLECSEVETREMSKWYTPCESVGINVNTAPVETLEGVLAWQRLSVMSWTDRPSYGQWGVANTPIHLWPLPSFEQIVVADPPERPNDLLGTTLPEATLFPLDPSTPYRPLRHLVHLAWGTAPFSSKWLSSDNRRATWQSGADVWNDPKWGYDPYAVRPNAWLKYQAVQDVQSMVAHRPYAVNDVTQPLGLIWFTPESWFTPLTPSAVGEFEKTQADQEVPLTINVALTTSAFTGWLSLQGPGPYRVSSAWYTFIVRDAGMSLTSRWTLRLSPSQIPVVLLATVEEE